MCVHRHESSKNDSLTRNQALKAIASRRLGDNKNNQHLTSKPAAHHVRVNGKLNKPHAKLSVRIADWQNTIDSIENKNKDMSGYHKPGSLQ